jgi:hypothetical protein
VTVTAPYTGSARRVYFDAQQFNYFAGPDTSPHPEHALHRVSRAVKAGKIEVVGSLDLLQEVIEAFPQAGKKARRMVDLFFKLVGDRLLLPLSERHRQETSTGGVLSEEDRYLSRDSVVTSVAWRSPVATCSNSPMSCIARRSRS